MSIQGFTQNLGHSPYGPRTTLNNRETRFAILFVVALLISFSPSTPLGQISVLLFLIGLIFYVQVRPRYHIKKYASILILYSIIGCCYWIIFQEEFSFINFYLFFVTGSSFLILFFDFRSIISDALLDRLGQIALVFICVESIVGVLQAAIVFLDYGTFDGSVGDFVWGTLAPPLNSAYAGRSPSFVLLISTLLFFSLAVFRRRWSPKYVIAYGSVLMAWLLSSLMHSFLYIGLAAALGLLTINRINLKMLYGSNQSKSKRKRSRNYGAAVIIVGGIILAILVPRFLPGNTAKIEKVFNEISSLSPDSKFLKIRAINSTIFDLPEEAWIQPVIGVGPGQYASRAALMTTGVYLTRPIPGLPEQVNTYTGKYILPHLNVIRSSLHLPSSSWLAIYGELGLVGFVLVIIVVVKGILFFRRYRSIQFHMLNLMMLILIYYLVFMSIQNVYLEYTQAIFPAILSTKLCYDFVSNEFGLKKPSRIAITTARRRKFIW